MSAIPRSPSNDAAAQTDAEGFLRIQGLPYRVQGRMIPRSF